MLSKMLSTLPRTLLACVSIVTGEEEFEGLGIPDDLQEIILQDVSEFPNTHVSQMLYRICIALHTVCRECNILTPRYKHATEIRLEASEGGEVHFTPVRRY